MNTSRSSAAAKTPDLFSLVGKKALVTGCSRGIGLAVATGLAEAGADIIGVSASLRPSGSEVGQAVESAGRRFRGYRADFSDREALHAFIAEVNNNVPVIDILVNNAGTIQRKPAVDHPDSLWDIVVETNLAAPFILSREIGKEMVARGCGKIIFTASLLTFQGGITEPGSAASKMRGGAADQGTGQRVGAAWGQCQRHRPRLRVHRQHGGVTGRPGPQQGHIGPHPGRPLGESR